MAAKLVFTVFACLIAFQAVCADSDSSPEEANNNYFSRWGSRLGGLFNRFGGNQQQRGGFGYNSNNNRNGAQAGLRLGANHEQDGRARLGTTWNYRNNAAEQDQSDSSEEHDNVKHQQDGRARLGTTWNYRNNAADKHQADSSDSSDSSEHNNVNHQKDGRARLGTTWNYRNNAADKHQADSGDSSDSSEHNNVNHQKDGRARLGATWNYRNNAAKQHQADSGDSSDSSDSSEHDSGYQHEKKQSLQVSAKMSKAVTITDVLTVSSLHCASNNVKKVGEASRSITASLRALLSVRASATSKDDEESQIKEAAWASASTRLEIATEMLQQAAKSMERLLRGADASASASSSSGSSEEPKRDQSLNDWDNQEDNSSYSSGGW